jgi:NTP pyrophosphatase (non-canonical NTP hydrolase)
MTRKEREAAIDWFAMRIKLKMREPRNEAKGGWREDSPVMLLVRLGEECAELQKQLLEGDPHDALAVINECCDVAAFAMMIAHQAQWNLAHSCQTPRNTPTRPVLLTCIRSEVPGEAERQEREHDSE